MSSFVITTVGLVSNRRYVVITMAGWGNCDIYYGVVHGWNIVNLGFIEGVACNKLAF
jgi:hypothetical protein